MVGWHHQLNGHEFKQTLGNGDGQGGLACCSPWGHKELDRTERLNNNNNKHLKESRPSGLRGTGRGRPGLGSKPHSTEPWSSLKVLRDLKDQGAGATMFDSFFFFFWCNNFKLQTEHTNSNEMHTKRLLRMDLATR